MTHIVERLAVVLLIALACAAVGWTALAALGFLPWLELQTGVNGSVISGVYVQAGLATFLVALCFFIPAGMRVRRLEMSHRDFAVDVEDVTRAYAIVHAADRSGVFTLGSEFDAVRERLEFQASHPDLESLEPEVMTLAAQMSHQSRALAERYSDDKVARAKTFLEQRQQELHRMKQRIDHAKGAMGEISRWARKIELEESVAASQMDMIADEIRSLVAPLGMQLERGDNVVHLPMTAAE